MQDIMQDIIISRAMIKQIAQRIYDDVDAYDYQDSGYSMKDMEIAVAVALNNLVARITSSFEDFAFAGDVKFYSSSLGFNLRRHCDATGCAMPVRSDDDIGCQRHGDLAF